MPPGASPKIQIPRWIQLVGLPVLLLLIWVVAGRVFHVVFLFMVASLLALLFDPLVRWLSSVQLGRFRIRRGFSVAFVYLVFAAALIAVIWGLATVVVDQTKTAANRFDTYFTVVHGQPRPAPTPTATSTGSSTGWTRTGSPRSRFRSAATAG